LTFHRVNQTTVSFLTQMRLDESDSLNERARVTSLTRMATMTQRGMRIRPGGGATKPSLRVMLPKHPSYSKVQLVPYSKESEMIGQKHKSKTSDSGSRWKMMQLFTSFDLALEVPAIRRISRRHMIVETAIIFGVVFVAGLSFYNACRNFLGQPKTSASVVVARPVSTYVPKMLTAPVAEAETAAKVEPSPTIESSPVSNPAPAIYETVQPETSPALPPVPTAGGSPAATFGASPNAIRATRGYRRRSPPSISSAGKVVRPRERRH
jgi:hypothetical protein